VGLFSVLFWLMPCSGQGVCLGVADGVTGWLESGVDPALFSQALMYHAHRYSRSAWAGEPEVDPTLDYQEREQVEGWELTPYECMDVGLCFLLLRDFPTSDFGSWRTAEYYGKNASKLVRLLLNVGSHGEPQIQGQVRVALCR
jgi:protein phosphatase PTC7